MKTLNKTATIVKEANWKVRNKLQLKQRTLKLFAWGKTQRRLWPVFALGAILLIGSVGYGIYRQLWPQQSKDSTLGGLTQAAQAVGDKKDYDKAIATSLAARREAGTKEGRFKATLAVAGWYLEVNKYKEALFYYQDAEKLMEGEDVNVYLGIANSAHGVGNKDLAKSYYQKAADFYKKAQGDTTSNSSIISFLEAKAQSL